MMKILLQKPEKYPLDLVFHMELEIDYDFVKNVVNAIEEMCKRIGIPFIRIKPKITWQEGYEKWLMPTRKVRWCNRTYKLSAKKQLHEWIKEQHCRPVAYIGFCADEVKRFKYKVGTWNPKEDHDECYPLAEEGIFESEVLEWAKTQEIFDGWYKVFKRQGCWLCPQASFLELAYLLKHFPERYEFYMDKVSELETKLEEKKGRKFNYWTGKTWDQVDKIIRNKYLKRLNEIEELSHKPHQQEEFF